MRTSRKSNVSTHRRRGGVYIIVMGAAVLVAMTGLCALHIARLELRQSVQERELEHARFLAQSAVELTLSRLTNDPDWRTNHFHGAESPNPPIPFDGGTLSYKLYDPMDGELAGGDADPIEIRGIGRTGKAVFVFAVNATIDASSQEPTIDFATWRQSEL